MFIRAELEALRAQLVSETHSSGADLAEEQAKLVTERKESGSLTSEVAKWVHDYLVLSLEPGRCRLKNL